MSIFKNNKKKITPAYSCHIIYLFLIGIVLILSYKSSLSGIFVFDDFGNIVGNKHLYVSSITYPEIKKVFSPYQNSKSRPIANLTFALNYYFGKLNPVGFHYINILIHIFSAWSVFHLFQWYFRRIPPQSFNTVVLSGIASLWWATNPMQTTAVSYIVQRMTSLSTLFCLLSILFYLYAREQTTQTGKTRSTHTKIFLYLSSIAFWLIALLSKEIAAILPLLILVHELYFFDLYSRFKERKKLYLSTLSLLAIVFIGEVFHFMGTSFLNAILAGYDQRSFTLGERLLTESRVVFHYIGLFLYPLPSRLRLFYDTYPVSTTLWHPAVTSLAVTGIFFWLGTIIYFFKKNTLLSFGLTWTFLCLLIESTVIPLELVFEHRFYLPSVGFVLVLVSGLIWLWKTTRFQSYALYGFIFILIGSQIIGTIHRNSLWGNQLSFAINEVQQNPDSTRTLNTLALALINDDQRTLAITPLLKVLRLDPDNITALNNLFSIYSNPPNQNRATAHLYLQKILDTVKNKKTLPTDTDILNKLAFFLFKTEHFKQSLLLLHRVNTFFQDPSILQHIGQCYLHLGKYKRANKYLKQALQLQPENPEILFYYAWSYQELNNFQKARELLSTLTIDDIHDDSLKNNISELLKTLNSSSTENSDN